MKHIRGHKRRHKEAEELNITAFMNLMVILVPFLLITAVFSRLAVIELNLPSAQSQVVDQPPEPELQLEITIRGNAIEVGDRNEGRLRLFENSDESYDFAALSDYLQTVKRTFPDKADATVLLEPEIAYQVIVEVMDTVRVVQRVDEASSEIVRYELFPEISIGDAPIPN